MKTNYDVIIIGSGPGGVGATIGAKKAGAQSVLVIERDVELGGILLQCIHNGFGVENLGEELPGPSYAQHYIQEMLDLGVETLLDTMVIEITPDKKVIASSQEHGYLTLEANAVVLAMGCRERSRAQIQIPGPRPAGVYTAGTAQRWVNMEGYMPGEKCVILGSGDIGLIMARRMTFEGAKVERVVEIMPFINGLTRNFVQCCQDFEIPTQLQTTVKRIIGKDRIEAVEIAQVDDKMNFIPGTEETIECDTLLLSVGLIPENELSRSAGVELSPITGGPIVDDQFQTNVPGIFAAGNVVHVYDLADWVTIAGIKAGENAANYANARSAGQTPVQDMPDIEIQPGQNVRYVVPQKIAPKNLHNNPIDLQLRVTHPIEEPVHIQVLNGDTLITRKVEQYVRPGEMVSVKLKEKDLEALQGVQTLSVRILEKTKVK